MDKPRCITAPLTDLKPKHFVRVAYFDKSIQSVRLSLVWGEIGLQLY